MRKRFALLLALCATLPSFAATLYGVQLFDMYGTEDTLLLEKDAYDELKAEIAEEKKVFNKVLSEVRKDWEKQVKEARKSGDKEFPDFPKKDFIQVRTMKVKQFASKADADKWYAKQKGRTTSALTAKANAEKAAAKAAKGSATAGYKDRDAKKARKKAEKSEMDAAVREKLSEEIVAKMSDYLKYNRPVPRIIAIDAMAGAEEGGADAHIAKEIAKQEAALQAYRERKAQAEAELGTPED